jgi:exodeoxyribonuclease V beta subunit
MPRFLDPISQTPTAPLGLQNTSQEALKLTELPLARRIPLRLLSYSTLSQWKELGEDSDARDVDAYAVEFANDFLPKGPAFGSVFHDLMERADFSKLCSSEQRGASEHALLESLCRNYGLSLNEPQNLAFWTMVEQTLNTPLGGPDALPAMVHLTELRKEMPFTLAVPKLDGPKLNRALSHFEDTEPLRVGTLKAFLSGYMDLVFAWNSRYYVLDYKTNLLQHYDEEALLTEMRQHNYGLQHRLYTLALHLHLKQTLKGYDPESHLGGAVYTFVRGMNPIHPVQGIFLQPFRWNDLHRLANALEVAL